MRNTTVVAVGGQPGVHISKHSHHYQAMCVWIFFKFLKIKKYISFYLSRSFLEFICMKILDSKTSSEHLSLITLPRFLCIIRTYIHSICWLISLWRQFSEELNAANIIDSLPFVFNSVRIGFLINMIDLYKGMLNSLTRRSLSNKHYINISCSS